MTDEELQKELVSTVHDYMADAGFEKNMYEIKTYESRIYCEVFDLTTEGTRYVVSDLKKSKFKKIINVVKHMYLPHKYSLIFTFIEN